MNSVEIADHFINRAKHLKEFIVETEVPDDFKFNGLIPFDMEIKNNIITAKVFALTFNEAAEKLDKYLENCK
jgi:hypothetical protein